MITIGLVHKHPEVEVRGGVDEEVDVYVGRAIVAIGDVIFVGTVGRADVGCLLSSSVSPRDKLLVSDGIRACSIILNE